jgi:rhamnosyltransferase
MRVMPSVPPRDLSILYESRIIIPVRNGGARWREAAKALREAVPDPSLVVVVDSSSTDGSAQVAVQCGFELQIIDSRAFNHGRTRQEAAERFGKDRSFVVFLTHDAVIEGPDSLTKLLGAFAESKVGAAYGRQIPHRDARPFARHTATFLYPAASQIRTLADAPRHGVMTAHISNSFAAYRIQALKESGGFPSKLILGEDVDVAFRMLQAGWSVKYCADAVVRHSHDYSTFQDMQRYFDYGVFHSQSPQLVRDLGEPGGNGLKFVSSELKYLAHAAPWLMPASFVRNFAKYLGYKLGRGFRSLPNPVRRRLSMTRGFW